MINANAFISLRGNRVHVAAFTREHLDCACEQVRGEFPVIYQTPVFRSQSPMGFNTELVIDMSCLRASEEARLSNAKG